VKLFSRKQRHLFWLLAPGLIFVLLLVGYGLLQAIIESIQTPGQSGAWTLNYYKILFADSMFWDSLGLSLKITLLSTGISLFIGIFLTKWLYHYLLKEKWKLIIWIPMLIPHFVAGYIVLFFFSQSGWFSALFYQLGFIADRQEFPILVMDRGGIGIILSYVWKEVPFVVLMLLPVYYQLDHRYKDVVYTLGGGRWQAFRTAEWPWLAPVVAETGIIIFAFIFAAFELPYLLGVTYPKMLPVLAYEWFSVGDWSGRPLAMATMITTTFFILMLSIFVFRYSQSIRYHMMRGGSE
jgi:putative spermidine/putrescine transport system permease protein